MKQVLNVIVPVFNPCMYARRISNVNRVISSLVGNPQIRLHIVELAYGDRPHLASRSDQYSTLCLRTNAPFWHKENLINIAINRLFAKAWTKAAWIDGDILFEDPMWALNTLQLLELYDVVQPFTTCDFLDESGQTMFSDIAASASSENRLRATNGGIRQKRSPGYAMAFTRRAYECVNGILDCCILGGGDLWQYRIFCGSEHEDHVVPSCNEFRAMYDAKARNARAMGLSVAAMNGNLLHLYHGQPHNRHYFERYRILCEHNFNPIKDLTYDKEGVIVPSEHCSAHLLAAICDYFRVRREDD